MFAPKIISIENFAEEMAGLQAIGNTTTLFEFYSVYSKAVPQENLENFETFSTWAQTLIYDFNEIDRYLIEPQSFFGYLSEIQEINHWYLQENKTPLMQNYLSFWKKLPSYYELLKQSLANKKMAYQGMAYRKASENVEAYLEKNENPHVFLGFNALNNAEQHVIQRMLKSGNTEIFWDTDQTFMNDPVHDASLFLRSYQKNWPYYQKNEFKTIFRDYLQRKNINIYGIPKNIGQAKYVGELLSKFSETELKKTAVILGDEALLLPVLNSLPPNISQYNVTMGYPLKNAPVSYLFEKLLEIHSDYDGSWFYKNVLALCKHPLLLKASDGDSQKLSEEIQKQNLVYLSTQKILENQSGKWKEVFQICFGNWNNNPKLAIANLQKLVFYIKEALDKETDKLSLEFLYQQHLLLNSVSNLMETYPHITSIKSLLGIYKDLLSTQTVDFRGKPFNGLQIMGVLESRVLDFENVILCSVNEGILPAGKSSNSFIPFDLKNSYNLPTYKEKDAVYTYHFYHLLQRTKTCHLLYNTETDSLNSGEPSRFLLQLEMENQPNHKISRVSVAPKVPGITSGLQVVEKTPQIMAKLQERAEKGFSPSALTSYIRNPIDFYHQYVLGIREQEEVEETVAYNTLGTVVHQTLETFYKPWEGKEINLEFLKQSIQKTPTEVALQFEKEYSREPISTGKNLLIFEVAKRFVLNFLKKEIKAIEEGNSLKVLQIETHLRSEIKIPGLNFPVFIHGMVDRVDKYNGIIRIIDFKTGKVEQKHVEVVDWEELSQDYDKYGKSFQILTYAMMLNDTTPFQDKVEAGIISFKNLQNGFLKFSKKDKPGSKAVKHSTINNEILNPFRIQLEKMILEICNPEIPFREKEIKINTW